MVYIKEIIVFYSNLVWTQFCLLKKEGGVSNGEREEARECTVIHVIVYGQPAFGG